MNATASAHCSQIERLRFLLGYYWKIPYVSPTLFLICSTSVPSSSVSDNPTLCAARCVKEEARREGRCNAVSFEAGRECTMMWLGEEREVARMIAAWASGGADLVEREADVRWWSSMVKCLSYILISDGELLFCSRKRMWLMRKRSCLLQQQLLLQQQQQQQQQQGQQCQQHQHQHLCCYYQQQTQHRHQEIQISRRLATPAQVKQPLASLRSRLKGALLQMQMRPQQNLRLHFLPLRHPQQLQVLVLHL